MQHRKRSVFLLPSILLSSVLTLIGCQKVSTDSPESLEPGAVNSDGSASPTLQAVSDVRCLRRVSLALTEKGPSAEQVQTVQSGGTIADVVDTYLESEDFSSTVEKWFLEAYPPGQDSPSLEGEGSVELDYFYEPARLAKAIVVNGMDYRLLLTADFTVNASGNMVPFDSHPYPAGVLSTRHLLSDEIGSLSRNWAGARLYQLTGIVLAAVTLDENEEVDTSREGIANNPNCAGCHVNEFWGIDFLGVSHDCFREGGTLEAGCTPATTSFLGQEVTGLSELGAVVSQSKEFKSQTVNFFHEKLTGRELFFKETQLYYRLAQSLDKSNFNAKELIKAIVTDPEYCIL